MKSRKFIGMLIGVGVIVTMIIVCAIFAPTAISPAVLVASITMSGFLISVYIGGNAFSSYIKSKHFVKELFEEGKDEC